MDGDELVSSALRLVAKTYLRSDSAVAVHQKRALGRGSGEWSAICDAARGWLRV